MKGGPQKASQILNRMKQIHNSGFKSAMPNGRSYANLLLACALAPGDKATKRNNLQLAVNSFNEFRESKIGEPNNVLFNRLLMACIYLTSTVEDRQRMATLIFRQCCIAGQLDSNFLKHFLEVASCEMKKNVFGQDHLQSYNDIPLKWKRNVKPQRKPVPTNVD